ncbi:MAG TPA: hypothetical protein VFW65_38220 [Pseudonocardiaceae bacterium]|nr:hypothetical protein [Pseudonocardiaceae bacterium]
MSFSLEIKHYDHDGPIVVATNDEIGMLLHLFHALSVPLTEPWLEDVTLFEVEQRTSPHGRAVEIRKPVRWVNRYNDGFDEDNATYTERVERDGEPNVLLLSENSPTVAELSNLLRPTHRLWGES